MGNMENGSLSKLRRSYNMSVDRGCETTANIMPVGSKDAYDGEGMFRQPYRQEGERIGEDLTTCRVQVP